ncbi:hypothetical protein HUT16_30185 [Kitasatospora sp. NA04385]|uniref:hypothetical protein n=1 Tax=Kitasatospora sp. NA04385 TaxID=2742135 RepID=UPI0015925952|nr:hypothetical protein [Kitasatospora sp. NA04385]QKW22792.1 hypothetical protein HUT16_30185 [Kitasatospora sp. NA04385]
MRSVITPPEGGPVHPGEPDDFDGFEEPAPEPVFVDQSGLRGRLLRGLGWPISLVGAVLAVAMGGSLIGVQADAPPLVIPPQPTQAPAAAPAASPAPSASPSASASASSSPSATGTAGRSATPGAKSSTGSSKSPSGSAKPGTSKSASKPTAGSAGSTASGQSVKHS